jgi:hypothetical protein
MFCTQELSTVVELSERTMKECRGDSDNKKLKLKLSDILARVKGVLIAKTWKEKRDVCILTNVHEPTAEGNFCDECGRAHKPATVEDYSRHMSYVNKGNRMANSCSVGRRTWKWTKVLLFTC